MDDFTTWVQEEMAIRPSIDSIAAAGSILVKIDNVFSRDYEALAQGNADQILISNGASLAPSWTSEITVDTIQFNLEYADGHVEGRLQWNSDDGTLEFGLPGGNVNLQIGQELLVRCRNTTGADIVNGSAVVIYGALANRPLIKLADATVWPDAAITGLATETIANNDWGYVALIGLVRDVNTVDFSEGDLLYLDPATPGGYTNIRPSGANYITAIGYVISKHETEGVIAAKPVWVPSIIGLSHVTSGTPNNGDILKYNSTSSTFELFSGDAYNKTGWDLDAPTKVNLTIDSGTRTVSITPTGDDAYYYIDGIKYTFDTTKSVIFDNTEGHWFIYFDGAILTAAQTELVLNNTRAYVASVYWDATNNVVITFLPEWHSWVIQDHLHAYLHKTFGTRWDTGLGVAEATSTTLDVAQGIIFDEDIECSITDELGADYWDQPLTPLEAPILYRDGAQGNWRKVAATTNIVHLISNAPQINLYTGGTWQLIDVTVNQYFAYWVIASTNKDEPIYLIPGQVDSGNLNDAISDNVLADMNFGNLPSAEHKVIARVIIRRLAASPYYEITQIDDYRDYTDTPQGGGTTVSDHGNLTGLSDDDHTQYHNDSRAATWLASNHETTYNHSNYDGAVTTLLDGTSGQILVCDEDSWPTWTDYIAIPSDPGDPPVGVGGEYLLKWNTSTDIVEWDYVWTLPTGSPSVGQYLRYNEAPSAVLEWAGESFTSTYMLYVDSDLELHGTDKLTFDGTDFIIATGSTINFTDVNEGEILFADSSGGITSHVNMTFDGTRPTFAEGLFAGYDSSLEAKNWSINYPAIYPGENGQIHQWWFPRAANFTDGWFYDYQDELAYIHKTADSYTVTPSPDTSPWGTNDVIFEDSSDYIQWDTGSSPGTVVVEIDTSSNPIYHASAAQWCCGLTFRYGGMVTGIKVEVDVGSGYTTVFDESTSAILDAWVSPVFNSPSPWSIQKLKVTVTLTTPLTQYFRIQRVMLYHTTGLWDPWHLHISGGPIYGDVNFQDNDGIIFGTGDDSDITWDGTNLVIDTGSGILDVIGTLQTDGYNSADGTTGATADVAVAKYGGGTRTLHFKNGLYTGYTDS